MTDSNKSQSTAAESVVYKDDYSRVSNFSIVSCAESLLPILEDYGIPSNSKPVITYKYEDTSESGVFGDVNGARLEYSFSHGMSDPYSGNLGYMILKSHNLVNRPTDRTLVISIDVELLAWTSDQVHIYFEGPFETVENVKSTLRTFLAASEG